MALTEEYLRALDRYPEQAAGLGGKVLGGSYFAGQRGFAFEASTTAVTIDADGTSGGPLVASDLVPAALYVISAPDMDTAVRIASSHPAVSEGGVEVRPLVPPPKS